VKIVEAIIHTARLRCNERAGERRSRTIAASRPESIAEPAHRLDFHLCPGDLPSEMRDVNLNQVGAWLEFVPKHFPKEVAPTDHVTGPPQQKLQQRMLAR